MKAFIFSTILAAMFVIGGCSAGESNSKSVTTTAKITEDGSEVISTTQ